MNFDPGFDITTISDPLGFKYGKGVFGPEVELRTLDSIRASLEDSGSEGPEIVYSIAMDVGNSCDRVDLIRRNLLFGCVTYAKGQIGREPVRSQGHIHAISPSVGMSTPEVYEIWSGTAIIYMQEYAEDNPGRCFAVRAEPGEVVIVPPLWAHATENADPGQNMTFGAWCVRDYGFEYDKVRSHKGLAWYPVIESIGGDDLRLIWEANKHYHASRLIEKSPRTYSELGITAGVPIYEQYSRDRELFMFVPRPDYFDNWEEFVP